jgi:NAD(P)-dependent dehydrogenase (short-subunit alcohol dehydrogenase family)
MKLINKTILVFGACGRLGIEISKRLRDEGAIVFATDKIASEEMSQMISEDSKPNPIKFCAVDVTNEMEVEMFFKELPALNGVVNCSYPVGKGYGTDFLKQDLESFNSTLNSHLGSAFIVTQHSVRKFINQKVPLSIVNFSSIYGGVAPRFEIYEGTTMTTPVEYPLMKAAIESLNGYVSKYIRNSNLRINTISPGGILAEQPDSFLKGYGKYTRGKGMLESQDVCGGVVFLLSEDSKYITGQNIVIDDGFSL